jgi:hypothetical protein
VQRGVSELGRVQQQCGAEVLCVDTVRLRQAAQSPALLRHIGTVGGRCRGRRPALEVALPRCGGLNGGHSGMMAHVAGVRRVRKAGDAGMTRGVGCYGDQAPLR